MDEKTFKMWLIGLGVVVLLSAAPFPGALIGFCMGIAVAFFVAPVAFFLSFLFKQIGLDVTKEYVAYGLLFVYIALVAAIFYMTWHRWQKGDDLPLARLMAMKAIFLAALVPIGYLSSQALMDAWP